jgi:glutathione peroxidase
MWKSVAGLLSIVCLLGTISTASAEEKKDGDTVLDVKMKSLEGKDVDLNQYKGKVVLFVNVASKCGLTPQYEQLQALHEKYADDGLAIVGVPSNQFGSQEPGTAAEIREFCDAKYSVKFDLLEKVDVNGEQQCELYKRLTSKEAGAAFPGEISWNFEKFLVGRDGKVLARYAPRTKPNDPKVIEALEAELANK